MKDMREITTQMLPMLQQQEEMLDEVDVDIERTLEETAAGGEQLKLAYAYRAKKRRIKVAIALAMLYGTVGAVVTGGFLIPIGLAVGGGFAGHEIGRKIEEKAEKRADALEFEK
jgi:t-SNARE complex subunit (syntaxin)